MNNLAIFFAVYAIYFLGAVVVWLWLSGHRRLAWQATLSSGLAWLSGKFIKDFFYLPRPYIVGQHHLLTRSLLDGSFPSHHAAVAFGLSFAIYFAKPKLGTWLLATSLLIAVSRVMVGVHYPIDILAGGILGYVSARVIRLTNYHSR